MPLVKYIDPVPDIHHSHESVSQVISTLRRPERLLRRHSPPPTPNFTSFDSNFPANTLADELEISATSTATTAVIEAAAEYPPSSYSAASSTTGTDLFIETNNFPPAHTSVFSARTLFPGTRSRYHPPPRATTTTTTAAATTRGTTAPQTTTSQRPKPTHLSQPTVYACRCCRTHLASNAEIVSRDFRGNTGDAYLVKDLLNVANGPVERKAMLTGTYLICTTKCNLCKTVIGWKYLKSDRRQQRYKEGMYTLEVSLIFCC